MGGAEPRACSCRRINPGRKCSLRQHPPNEAPAISLRFAEPPSDVGTGGGQMGERGAGAVVVVFAACVDVSGISPGNSDGD